MNIDDGGGRGDKREQCFDTVTPISEKARGYSSITLSPSEFGEGQSPRM